MKRKVIDFVRGVITSSMCRRQRHRPSLREAKRRPSSLFGPNSQRRFSGGSI
ncbi:hypothetical protein I6N90_14985 [Paenibacillus sp. GSMTC-2017]|uniref:hypothetical protein n=1 Tax=Paenibacillus sp. GSMTC-2017 TaxID=2794350 RepID=UPI0018D8C6FD|nr:hypothetical protein [Paenibacillus sp. GSMTC-2017]MBH5319110.1 hypothetical protein [Paenibacillus sp. GSMTC-2017]